MSNPIRNALHGVADIIERTYAHDDDGVRTNLCSCYSGADIVDLLCDMEGKVSDALRILDTQGRAVSDLPRATLETIVSVLLARFDCTEQGVSWDHQDVANCAYRMLEAWGLFGG